MSKRRAVVRAAALIAAVAAGTAVAQTQDKALAPPLLLMPAATGTPAASPEAGASDNAVPPAGPIIAINDLAAPRPDAMGLMDARSGGFPDDMWHGSQLETARGLVGALPHRLALRSAHRLAQRFLLSAAPPPSAVREPVVTDPDAPPGDPPQPDSQPTEPPPADPEKAAALGPATSALLEARIAALAGMGDWSDALAMIDFLPTAARSPEVTRLQVDGLLMENKVEAACGEAQRALDQATDVHWQQIQVFCQFTTGQLNPASLGLDLLREQGVDDKPFFWAADILKGNTAAMPADVAKPGTATPLVLAMLRKAGYLLPAELIATDDPSVLRIAAEIAAAPPPPAAPPPLPAKTAAKASAAKAPAEKANAAEAADDLRLLTVERAVLAGVADVEILRGLYAQAAVSAEVKASGQIAAATSRQRAATYQLARAQTVPTARAEVISRVLDLSRPRDAGTVDTSVVLTALVYAPMVMELSPAADVSWFAGTAARVLLAADLAGAVDPRADPAAPDQGLRGPARAWLDLVRGMATTSSEAHAVNDALWPYQQLVSGGAVSSEALRAWAATLPKEPAADSLQRQELLLSLLTAVGDEITSADWQPLLAQGAQQPGTTTEVPSPLIWQGLTLAAKARHIGECVALSLQLLGGTPAQPPPRLAVLKAIESLTAVGRAADARPLAIETALALGL